jgi:L-aminopeptidase/D-esterase-like protein
MPEVHAVVLTGGSSYGLESAMGAVRYLEKQERGFDVGVAKIPVVPAAVIYDLGVGSARVRPDLQMGMAACEDAKDGIFKRGSVGAGTGAMCGKFFGIKGASKGGLGTASVKVRGVTVAALMVVNAFGDVIDRKTGIIRAGTKKEDGAFADTYQLWKEQDPTSAAFKFKNTTIGIVCCDCLLTKEEANRIAILAHNGIARSIYPSHTSVDGDAIFATGQLRGDTKIPVDVLGSAAAEAVELAILDAVAQA